MVDVFSLKSFSYKYNVLESLETLEMHFGQRICDIIMMHNINNTFNLHGMHTHNYHLFFICKDFRHKGLRYKEIYI